jgi:hypothetical protein
MRTHRQYRVRPARLIGKTLLCGLMVCCLTDVACSQGKQAAYDVTRRRIDLIPPGVVIGDKAPESWTNLLIKSKPRPGAGDVKELSANADRLSRLLFTAILADVGTDGRRFKLKKIAVGEGVRIGDKDTIVTPETQKRLGADLGFLARVVLRTAQEKLADIHYVARSDTMILFDAAGLMVRDKRHKPVVLRYAVLVEERTGRLDTLVWVLDRAEGDKYAGPVGAIRLLSPNQLEDCVLHIDAREFSLGQPTEQAFAMIEAPKGRKEIAVGADLKPLAVLPRFSTEVAAQLEGKLREALKTAVEK